jgi:D-glycero-D-manno-heptose 1,7-bisphosphate phosphatase
MTGATAPRPAVFLDRDGTLIDDCGYLSDPAKVRLLPGAAEALIVLEQAGYLRIVVTNQSGIGRGLYPASAFQATQRELERQLAEAGASIDATYCCPHAPDAGCPCRKPGTALHREAIAVHDVDIARSWCVGDQLRDLEPASELGCQALLVRTGQGAGQVTAAEAMDALVAADLAAGSVLLSRYI